MLHSDKITPHILSAMCHMCDVGLLLLSENRRITFWNEWLEKASGIDAPDVLGKTLDEVFPNVENARLSQAIEEAFSHQLSAVLSPRLHHSLLPLKVHNHADADTAEKMEQLISLSPLLTESGQTCCLIQITDMTAAIARENILREQARSLSSKTSELEHALEGEKTYNALQKKFTALVSHEFRTPLTIIDGAAQRMMRHKGEMTPDDYSKRCGKIRRAVHRMTDLIDATLNISRLDEGQIELNQTPCNLRQLVSDVCERQSDISPTHNIQVDIDDLPNAFVCDKKLLEMALTNLLSNAVKYAPDNPDIDVQGWLSDGHAYVSVTDRGAGIPADDVPHMFKRFFRAKTAKGIPGTGIGLCISKEFIEMHGGGIDLESVEGEGTTFTVRLPMASQEPQT